MKFISNILILIALVGGVNACFAEHKNTISLWIAPAPPSVPAKVVLNWGGGYINYYGRRYDVMCNVWGSHGASCGAADYVGNVLSGYVSFGGSCETCWSTYLKKHE